MTIEECKDNIFSLAKQKGFEDCEVYISESKEFRINSFQQEIDDFSSSDTLGISFRGIYNNKMGYSYAEVMDNTSIKMLVEEALENAVSIDSEDKEFIHDGSGDYAALKEYKGEIEQIPVEDKLQMCLDLEKKLRDKEKVLQTNFCSYGESVYETSIFNTKGLEKQFKNDVAYLMGMAVVGEPNDKNISPKSAFSFSIGKDRSGLDVDYVVEDTYKRSTSLLGAKSIKSGKYRMVLENRMVNDLMATFSIIFCAESVQKGKSLLKGKLNEKIANEKLTIIDDPHLSGSISSGSFDAEGVATYQKEVVASGILKTYLHNMKTAAKDGVKSTGNAMKYSYKSPISVAPSNLVIKKGDMSFEDIIKECDKGIYITSLDGLHSGANPISGDFSLMAGGFKIENGKISTPIEQITISSNLFDLFNNIEAVGNDITASPPSFGTYYSPSLLIKEINVAGSEE